MSFFKVCFIFDHVVEVFRVAAEAHESDILKLYNVRGSLINISPKLPENNPETRYRLEVVASHNNSMQYLWIQFKSFYTC